MKRKLHKLTKHHIIPKSRFNEVKASFQINDNNNIKMLKGQTHDALHRLFGNKTPKEQLEMWYDINEKVLNFEVKKLLLKVLSIDDFIFYK